ncbi:MAG TPA: hypothetical protein DCM05_04705, partial [Elusimicrobia bacterium]|nr:hypothetical protein [Elusimicrobiota bacterium]
MGMKTLLLFVLLPLAARAEPELPVILFAGQSNMVGLARVEELSAEQARTQEEAYYYYPDGTWGAFSPARAAGSGLGPELSAGRDIAALTGRVGMIKYAVGGTNLALQWNPAVPGSLYQNLVRHVEGALAALKAQTGMKGRVSGFFWMQGESDAADPNMTVLYAANLANLIARVRADFGDPDLPFVFGKISPSPLWRYGAYVRAAQQSVADSVPNTALFSADDLPLQDGAHYTTQGVLTLGQRFAEAYLGRTEFEGARFLSQDVPAEMSAGKTYQVSVTMQNTGSKAWTRAKGFKLGSQSPQDNLDWGLGRVELEEGESVAPGERKTFTFDVTAPAAAGARSFEWKMLRESVLWFGDTNEAVSVKVSAPAAAAAPAETAAEEAAVETAAAGERLQDALHAGGTGG